MYEASVYQAKNDWKIKVRVDKEAKTHQVFRILDSTDVEELTPVDTKRYSTNLNESRGLAGKIFRGVEVGASILDFINTIIGLVA